MKTLSLAIFLSSLLYSCQRNYTCECYSDADNSAILPFSEYVLTEEDAESACRNADNLEGQHCELVRN